MDYKCVVNEASVKKQLDMLSFCNTENCHHVLDQLFHEDNCQSGA
jgi:hypothetical protein